MNSKPIARLGAQDATVVLDRDYIESSRETQPYYPHGRDDSAYNVDERQVLMSRVLNYSDDKDYKVVGTANGLGREFINHFNIGELPPVLEKTLALHGWRCAGISVTAGSYTSASTDGFVSTFSGTTTLRTSVAIRAGQRVVVDGPSKEELNVLKGSTRSGAIPFIVRPADDDISSQKLKQAVHAKIVNEPAWLRLVHKLPMATWGHAANNFEQSAIMSVIAGVKILIEAGLLMVPPPDTVVSPEDWRSSKTFRDDYHNIRSRMPPPAAAPENRTQADLALNSDAFALLLYKMFNGKTLENTEAIADYTRYTDKTYKDDMQQLRKALLITTLQDAESNVLGGYAAVKSISNTILKLSTLTGFIPGVVDPSSNTNVESLSYHINQVCNDGTNNDFDLTRSELSILHETTTSQANHLSKVVRAYDLAIKSEREIGVALKSADAGQEFEIQLNVK